MSGGRAVFALGYYGFDEAIVEKELLAAKPNPLGLQTLLSQN